LALPYDLATKNSLVGHRPKINAHRPSTTGNRGETIPEFGNYFKAIFAPTGDKPLAAGTVCVLSFVVIDTVASYGPN